MEVVCGASFADRLEDFGHCTLVQHKIETGDARSVRKKPYREMPKKKAFIRMRIDEFIVSVRGLVPHLSRRTVAKDSVSIPMG